MTRARAYPLPLGAPARHHGAARLHADQLGGCARAQVAGYGGRVAVLIYPPVADAPANVSTLEAVRRQCGGMPVIVSGEEARDGEDGAAARGEEDAPAIATAAGEGATPPGQGGQSSRAGGGLVANDFTSFYVVASTNDRIVPPESHADALVEEMRQAGVRVTYDRRRLGAHGFGVTAKWAVPCLQWLREQLRAAEPEEAGTHTEERVTI